MEMLRAKSKTGSLRKASFAPGQYIVFLQGENRKSVKMREASGEKHTPHSVEAADCLAAVKIPCV